jgi:hypothetical protein
MTLRDLVAGAPAARPRVVPVPDRRFEALGLAHPEFGQALEHGRMIRI